MIKVSIPNKIRITKLILVAAAVLASTLYPATADERDDKIKALEQQLQQQNERLKRLEQLLNQQGSKETPPPKPTTPANIAPPAPIPAPPIEQAATAKPPDTNAVSAKMQMASVSIGTKGFVVESADKKFSLKIGTLLQFDQRWYFDDISDNDMFLVRRARINIDGKVYDAFVFRIKPEFGGSSTSLRDAYLIYGYASWLKLQAGKFKAPIGLEQLQSSTTTLFIERSLVSEINPSRDVGGQIFGQLFEGSLQYAAGVFNGAGDGGNAGNLDTDGEKSVAGRVFAYPFQTGPEVLRGLGVGVGGSYARPEGAGELPSGKGYATEAQQQFFTYRNGVVADGEHWRISPQVSWYYGPCCLLGEYVITGQKVRRSDLGTSDTLKHYAWQVSGGYVFTGEKASPEGVVPRHPFNPPRGDWGALQGVLRVSSLKVDDEAFPLFANPATSASKALSFGAGLNWYLNPNIRVSVDYFHTHFDGGERGTVTREDKNAVLARLQLAF